MMNGLHLTMERRAGIAQARPERHTTPRGMATLRAAADTLSRRNADAAVCELMNEALARLIDLGFEQDAGGYCNLDAATGRLLIPLPWGRNGHARWGLRPQEANILREVLFAWQQEAQPLLFYDRTRRGWFVNLSGYRTHRAALDWLAGHAVIIAEYRAARSLRTPRAKRVGG